MKEIKVSVIVPVYNVEPFLVKCLDSIQTQTYTNWEAILIDDGSTDASGQICDEYAKKDNRFIVVHQKNGGLSNARNTGLSMVSGEYMAFCDSDDYYMPEMLEKLVILVQTTGKDICMCGFFIVDEEGNITDLKRKENEQCIGVFNHDEAIDMLYQNKFRSYVWNKIWNKSLFQNLEFSVGMTFEDSIIIPQLFAQSNGFAVTDYSGYAYFRYRAGNISSTNKMINELSRTEGALVKYRLAGNKYTRHQSTAAQNLINAYTLLCMMWKVSDCNFVKHRELWLGYKKEIKTILKCKLPLKTKIRGGVAVYFPKLLYLLGVKKRHVC